MHESHNHAILRKAIIELSDADTWYAALSEWELAYVYEADEPDQCLCSHSPIRELCVVKNTSNGKEAIVGNVCVKKFMKLDSGNIFEGIKRIAADDTKSPNERLLQYASEKGWLNDWERGFCKSNIRKRKLSSKQSEKRIQINTKILRRFALQNKHS